jgi:hypothetical protein
VSNLVPRYRKRRVNPHRYDGSVASQKWDPKLLSVVFGACALGRGKTDTDVARVLGVHEDTFHRWVRTIPAVREALANGRSNADAQVVDAIFRGAVGYSVTTKRITWVKGVPLTVEQTEHVPGDVKAQALWMGLRGYGNRPSDRQLPPPEGTEVRGPNGVPGAVASDVGQKLLRDFEAILTRAVDAVEEQDRQPAIIDAQVIEDGDAPCE